VLKKCRSAGDRPARAGETRVAFSVPAGRAKAPSPLHWQGPSPLPQRHAGIRTGRGPKAPGQRPPRPRRALPARRVGRWPLCLLDLPVFREPSRAGGGNAMRFLFPPGRATALSPLQWQGPSPLPQCCAGSGPAGGQSPRPAPAPPPAGALRPPGRALASVFPVPAGLQGTVPRGRGKRDAFPPPKGTIPFPDRDGFPGRP